jgi:hypothetical protein
MPMRDPQLETPLHESIIRRLGNALRAIIDRKDAEILILEREVELMRQRILALEERLEAEAGVPAHRIP